MGVLRHVAHASEDEAPITSLALWIASTDSECDQEMEKTIRIDPPSPSKRSYLGPSLGEDRLIIPRALSFYICQECAGFFLLRIDMRLGSDFRGRIL